MGFLSKFFDSLRGKPPTGSNRYLPVYVLSTRCREPIAGQIDMMNETSLDEEAKGGYYTRKVLHTSGKHRCFGEVEVEVWLDANKRVVRNEVKGGRWLTADEYATEVAAAEAREREEEAARAAQEAEQANQ
jgi:hypothetical protein